MAQTIPSEATSNLCAHCNGFVRRGMLCQCELNEASDTLTSSRDPIWVGDFPGTNESGVRQGDRIHRTRQLQDVWEHVQERITSLVCGGNSSDRIKGRSFLCGSLLLIFGVYLLIFPDDYGFQKWSLFIIGVGGLFVWIPVIYWSNESESAANAQEPRHVPVMDAPPRYDTLPKDPPPAYDLIFPEAADRDGGGVSPHSSGTVALTVPICSVHQPTMESDRQPATSFATNR